MQVLTTAKLGNHNGCTRNAKPSMRSTKYRNSGPHARKQSADERDPLPQALGASQEIATLATLATGPYRELRLRVRLMCLLRTAAVTIQSAKPAQRPISAELGCHAAGAGVPDMSRITELTK